jgi:hypothetical protein
MNNQWTDIETLIGQAQIRLVEDIIEANIEEEKLSLKRISPDS